MLMITSLSQTPVTARQPIESPTNEVKKLEDKWEESKCKTKLIAL